jgi:2-polyprenyl-6-hydroxyphenyl methylase/3-demethylubiquinone-9 3-methyltransferase
MKPPQPDLGWNAEVQLLYEHDRKEIWDRSVAPYIWNQYHNQLALYQRIAGTGCKDILDVGCAQATLALRLAEAGHRVCAVDIRQHFLDYAASRYTHGEIEFVCGDVMQLRLERSFDLIFANQILEHLVYPEQVVLRLKQLLRPGGMLVATTPNGEYVKSSLPSLTELGDRTRWEHRQNTADADGHFFAYRAAELVSIFAQADLRDIQAQWFESPFISGHMKVRFAHRILPEPILRLLDRCVLALPGVKRRLAHQLLVRGIR